jgi:cysteine synthase A
MVRLDRLTAGESGSIVAKLEYLNPGGSKKDRVARRIIEDAEKSGRLEPGQPVVELTSGNTGAGLAIACAITGHPFIAVLSKGASAERARMIAALGAEVVLVDRSPEATPGADMELVEAEAHRITGQRGAFRSDQFENHSNVDAHYTGTGPEIWAQTGGRVDGFICAVGSGGTLAGVADALRARNPGVAIGIADPHGAALYAYYTDGELKSEGTSISEGIGQGRITGNLEGLAVDRAYRISDEEMLLAIYDLAEHEGLVMGGSTGINVAGAIRMARDLGPGHTVVTILCDHGQRYQSKIYNPAFLRELGLPTPKWLES